MWKSVCDAFTSMCRGMADAFWPPERDFMYRTDEEAIASDWQAVGDDMRQAMHDFEQDYLSQSKNVL